MENTRPILYGVAGYAEIRQVNAWFIDRILISTSSRRGGSATSTTTTISNGTLKVEVASTARNSSNQGYHAWVHIANLNGKDGLNLDLGGSTLRMEGATANASVCGFTATPKYGDVKSTKTMEVYGTYLPASSYGFNMMMMDGSTVDLSGRTGSWNSRFSNTQNHLDTNTKVSFAANATITRSG